MSTFFSKFGSYSDQSTSVVGPPGVGFSVDANGDYDMQGKKLMDVGGIEATGLTASQLVATNADKMLVSIPYDTAATVDAMVQRDANGGVIVSTLTAGTSGNIVYNASASGSHQMQTNSSTKLTLNSSTLTLGANMDITGDIDITGTIKSSGDILLDAGSSSAFKLSHGGIINTSIDTTQITFSTSVKSNSATEAGSGLGAIVAAGGISAGKDMHSATSVKTNLVQAISGDLTLAGEETTDSVSIQNDLSITGPLVWRNGQSMDNYDVEEVSTTLKHGDQTNSSITIVCVRAGRLCNVYFPGVTFTNSTGSTINQFITSETAISSAFRPMGSIIMNASHTIAGTTQALRCVLVNTGKFSFQTTALGTISVADGQSVVLAPMVFAVVVS